MRLFVARGLANAYGTYGDSEVDYLYDVSEEWRDDVDNGAIAFDDPDLDVDWPVADPIVSAADRAAPTLRERYPDHPRFSGGTSTTPTVAVAPAHDRARS